jgi:hypothetical protein
MLYISVCPGCETSSHYFSYSGGPGAVSIKSAPGHVMPKLCFLHPVRSVGHVVHSGASGPRNIEALFFMLGWYRYRFNKKCIGTGYTRLVYLFPLGSMAHIVHSGAQNIDALFFMLRWA